MNGTVVITGGTKGLGLQMALAFGRAGYLPVALYSSDEQAAEQTRNLFAAESISGAVVRHDVTSPIIEFVDRPEIQKAQTLLLINNACATFCPMPMHLLNWADFENSFTVAVKGAWSCSQIMIRPMLRIGHGMIVNVLTAALEGVPPKGFAAYLTAKHALRGFTLSLAAEYSPLGLRIASISPGFMNTPLTEAWDPRVREAMQSSSIRITDPREAARHLVELVVGDAIAGNGEDYPI